MSAGASSGLELQDDIASQFVLVPKKSKLVKRSRKSMKKRAISDTTPQLKSRLPFPRPAAERNDGDVSFPNGHYILGQLGGIPVRFVIDTGSNANLLSKQIYDKLLVQAPAMFQSNDISAIARLTDGSSLPLHETVRIRSQLGEESRRDEFRICHMEEDVLLGAPYLINCAIDYARSTININGVELLMVPVSGILFNPDRLSRDAREDKARDYEDVARQLEDDARYLRQLARGARDLEY